MSKLIIFMLGVKTLGISEFEAICKVAEYLSSTHEVATKAVGKC